MNPLTPEEFNEHLATLSREEMQKTIERMYVEAYIMMQAPETYGVGSTHARTTANYLRYLVVGDELDEGTPAERRPEDDERTRYDLRGAINAACEQVRESLEDRETEEYVIEDALADLEGRVYRRLEQTKRDDRLTVEAMERIIDDAVNETLDDY